MMTPRAAIAAGEIWLRPFGHFLPEHQGYMGFSSETVRDDFLAAMRDGALVLIWTRQVRGEARWKGYCRGLLQLAKVPVMAASQSSAHGNAQRLGSDRDFSFAVKAVRAWEMDDSHKVLMRNVAPSIWPGQTQVIGHRSGRMSPAELPNLENLRVREVSVFGQPAVVSSVFEEVRKVF
ncbi:hypothetical protein [Kordiimonas sp.]|uniref:hypothetical protein n=1 Tax=Kordiimonas sp. TaxID=1970157 RepID=UPI003A8D9E09